MTRFRFIPAVVAALHLAALNFALGPWHWDYLLVAALSGALLWGALPALLPLRRWTGLLIGGLLALTTQQAAFGLWRAKLGEAYWPLVQFASLHFLIGSGCGWLRRSRPSTFVRRSAMLNPRRRNPTAQNRKLKSHDETLA
jgi:hypothetical protein